MAMLLCEPGNGVRIVQGDTSMRIDCPFAWPCAPCGGAKCAAFCCAESKNCLCLQKGSWKALCGMPCMPGVCEMCFSPCERYLYQLSSEADSLHARSVGSGELLYAVPAGVFSRSLRQEEGGKRLLCAGGALNRAFLFNAPDLTLSREICTEYPCVFADFWADGLLLVCAGEGDDIRTIVYTMARSSAKPMRIAELCAMPCAVCVCPDGRSALISTWNGVTKLRLASGQAQWSCPEWALCLKLACRGRLAVASDLPDGSVWLFCHDQPLLRTRIACSRDSQACFV